MNEKKALYIAIGFLQNFLGQTWVASLYNDPSFVNSHSLSEWSVICSLTVANSVLAALIVWKAFISTPANGNSTPTVVVPPTTTTTAPAPEPPKP